LESVLMRKIMRVFLNALLQRRYHNFSSDIILLMTGLGKVDEVFGVLLDFSAHANARLLSIAWIN